MVFYRKYRPQTIEELDSEEVRNKLFNVLRGPSVTHAYIFTGPKGLGKTSAARIVAKVLNCENLTSNKKQLTSNKKSEVSSRKLAVDIEPCNKCNQCKSITNGTNLDILEIDGASNRGIDEIRDLREKIKLTPIAAGKKVYIIDEVHMLTTEAFNALLKTLEEPPVHVIFILCTTEPHKVPATILSRCLKIQFKRATQEELVRSFARIIKKEKLKAEKEALEVIAGLSDGSFRDGVKILEEMALIAPSASTGQAKKITKELVQKNYSIVSVQYKIAQMIKAFEEKDAKKGLEIVMKLSDEGIEMGYFMQELIETLHNSLLLKAGVEFTSENQSLMIDSLRMEIGEIKRLIELLSKAKSELKYAVLPQIPLELAIVEWGLREAQKNAEQNVSAEATQNVQRNSASKSAFFSDKNKKVNKPIANIVNNVIQQNISQYSEHGALWTALIDKVKAYNHSIAGVLRGCSIKSYDGKALLLQANFKFHRDKLNEGKTREILGNALKEITKKNIGVEIVLKGR